MEQIYWDKLRVLATNKCNYRCPFCHNEGQEKSNHMDMMSTSDFYRFIDIIKDQPLSELNFSGGEPFMNKEITNMILYAIDNLSCDISCATNLSLLTEEHISKLSGTRIKFNIQFPYISEELFHKSTGNGKFQSILSKIRRVREAGISIALNTVVQSNDDKIYRNMILFAINEELPLKLLPQIGLSGSSKFKEFIYPILKEYVVEFKDKKTGATRWVLEKDGHKTSVLYIDSPCFNKDFEQCRNFAELRVLPDFSLQSCILKDSNVKLDLTAGKDYVLKQLQESWTNFKNC